MTVETQGTEIQFTDDQQAFIDKLVGKTRIETREKATAEAMAARRVEADKAAQEQLAAAEEWKKLAEMHEGRVRELEPFEIEAKAYRELVTTMLKDRIKELGDVAKKAVEALPLTDLEKLNWLNKNRALFATESTPKVGTPISRSKSALTDKGREQHRRLRL